MTLHSIHLKQFRSHNDRLFEFSPSVTMIVGLNGSGKTNILEAVQVLMGGKSFRDTDEDLISYGQDWWRIDGLFDDETKRTLSYQPSVQRSKQLSVDEAPKTRFTYRHQLPTVLFEPDDLLIVHGSPGGRRAYIDDIAAKLDPIYKTTLNKYERALTQRNNLLKTKQSPSLLKDQVFAWDILLAEHGVQIMNSRQAAIDQLNEQLSASYSRLAGSEQSARLIYQPTVTKSDTSYLVAQLNSRLSVDAMRGFTTVGPHRDDIDIILNDKPAKTSASRGEVRSLMLALKLTEVEMITDQRGVKPILLLDDVFSELDKTRQEQLIGISSDTQTIITTTDSDTAHAVKRTDLRLIELG